MEKVRGEVRRILLLFLLNFEQEKKSTWHTKRSTMEPAGTFFRSDSTDQAFICFLPWMPSSLSPAHDDDWSTCVAVSLGKSAPRRRHARYPQLLSPDIERTKNGPVKDQQDIEPPPPALSDVAGRFGCLGWEDSSTFLFQLHLLATRIDRPIRTTTGRTTDWLWWFDGPPSSLHPLEKFLYYSYRPHHHHNPLHLFISHIGPLWVVGS